MANDLIEEPATDPIEEGTAQGAKIFFSVSNAREAYGQVVTQGKVDVGDIASSTYSLYLDSLSLIADPFKHLSQAGLAFAIEYFDFLREPLNWLAGNPLAIEALAGTWNNIAMELNDAAESLRTEIQSTIDWDGQDAEAYRDGALAFSDVVDEAANGAVHTSNTISVVGGLIAFERNIVLELITNFVFEAIVVFLSALALSYCSFGASVGAAIARLITRAVSVFANIVAKIGKLMSKVGRILSSLNRLGAQNKALSTILGKIADSFKQAAAKGGSRQGINAFKNDFKNPINLVKASKYAGNSAARAENQISQNEQDREANGGP